MAEEDRFYDREDIVRKLIESVQYMVEAETRYKVATEKQERRDYITPEEAEIFLNYYKA